MRLYYMKTSQYGLQDIKKHRSKISRVDKLNDPFEMHPVHMGDKDTREVFKRFANAWGQRYGLLCFTKTWQNPVMWAHYGDRHYGLCLGFDIQDDLAEEVKYRKTRMKYILDVNKPQFGIGNQDIRQTILTKFADWEYEQECRILLPLAGQQREGEHYFRRWNHQFALREVLIGARCHLTTENIVPLIVRPAQPVSIRKVRPGFTQFRMEYQQQVREVIVPSRD